MIAASRAMRTTHNRTVSEGAAEGVVRRAFLDGDGTVLLLAHIPGVVEDGGVGFVGGGDVGVRQEGVEEGEQGQMVVLVPVAGRRLHADIVAGLLAQYPLV